MKLLSKPLSPSFLLFTLLLLRWLLLLLALSRRHVLLLLIFIRALLVNLKVLLHVDFIKVNRLIDISIPIPLTRSIILVEAHEVLQSLRGSICVPKLEASLYILGRLLPVALNVRLERLPEDGIELLDMLLKTN